LELRDVVSPNTELGLGEIPFGGVTLTYNEFDIYAVMNDTGFVPEVEFKEGIRRTTAWIKENG
jgi:nucleoside-diphosphate-sugar epimerase